MITNSQKPITDNMKYKFGSKETEISFHKNFGFELDRNSNKIFIIDKLVYDLYKDKLQNIISIDHIYLLEAKEENKNLNEIQRIYDFFHENKVNRSTIIYGIGGGITTDITAFAASTYMRGCRLILMPSTFLGMIDAAVGGKTAVNFKGIKNNIGTFYPAEKVIIIPEFLETLPEKEMKNGWTECIKISLIKKSKLFDLLTTDNEIIIDEIIKLAISLKAEICENDPEDKGKRRLLNLGHTFGHILETISNFEISHGNAVAIGIRAAATLSLEKGFIEETVSNKIDYILDMYGLPKSIDMKFKDSFPKQARNILSYDKKTTSCSMLIIFAGFQKTKICKDIGLEETVKIFEDFFN